MNPTLLSIVLLLLTSASAKMLAQSADLADYIQAWDTLNCIGTGVQVDFRDSILFNIAELNEIVDLARHPNPLVRAKVLLALTHYEQKDSIPFAALLAEHLTDTATVDFCASIQRQQSMISFSVARLYASLVANATTEVSFYVSSGMQVDSIQQQTFDSLLLCQYLPDLKERASRAFSAANHPALYPQLRQLVREKHDRDALIYLSRWQQEEDVELVLSQINELGFEKTWIPLFYFQHPRLLDTLGHSMDSIWHYDRYPRVIAKYQNEQAAALLQEIYDRRKAANMRSIQLALAQNFTVLYADLFLQLLSEQPLRLHEPLPDSLWVVHGGSLLQLFHKWDSSEDKWVRRSAKHVYDQAKAYQAAHHPAQLAELVLSQLAPGADYTKSATSVWHIWKERDLAFVEPLFELLNEEPTGTNRFMLLKLLEHYKEVSITARLENWVRDYPSLVPTIEDAIQGGRMFKNIEHYAQKR